MLSKAEQLKRHAPLKQKPFKSKAYLKWLHSQNFGCLVCGNTQIEIHHLDHGNRGRADNKCVILCPECHRGSNLSPHGTPNKWKELYPNEILEDIADKLFNQYKGE